jgi:tryptophan-rich sensory protein
MAFLGVCIWLVSAVISFLIAEVLVYFFDRPEWDFEHRLIIAVWCLLLGPVALVTALLSLVWAEIGRDAQHRITLRFKQLNRW